MCFKTSEEKRGATHAVQMLVWQGPSFYLKTAVKTGHNSKSRAFRVMPLALQDSRGESEKGLSV